MSSLRSSVFILLKVKTTMTFMLSLLLLSVAQVDAPEMELRLKCSEIPVKAEIGQDVTLNCSCEPHLLTRKQIKWVFNNSKTVLNHRKAGFSDEKDKQFKNRSYPGSGWNVSEGKLPLKISSVNKNDTGNYTCVVRINQRPMNCSAGLIVGHQEDNNAGQPGSRVNNDTLPTEKPGQNRGDNKRLHIGIAPVIVIVIVIVIGIGIRALWEKCRNHSGHGGGAGETTEGNRRNSQDNQELQALHSVKTEPSTNTQE